MDSIVRMLVSTNWPMVFIVFYLSVFCIFVFAEPKKYHKLILLLKENINSPRESLVIIDRYIKKHPLSLSIDTLRVFAIQLMLLTDQKQNVKLYSKKIRPINLYENISDQLLYTIFLLKEYGYQAEYEMLKEKSQANYKPFDDNLFRELLTPKADASAFIDYDSSQYSNYIKGIVSYYKGVVYFQNNDLENSKKEFNNSQQYIPNIHTLLKSKGYIV